MTGKRAPNRLTREQYARILARARRRSERDYVLLMLCGNAGLRVSELVELRAGALLAWHGSGGERMLRVQTLKQRRPHEADVLLHARVGAKLARYIRRRGIAADAYLFRSGRHSSSSEHLSRMQAWRVFRRHADAVAVPAGVSIHALRHLRAAELSRAGARTVQVAAQLRHSSVRSTERYLELAPEELADIVEKAGAVT